jgi:phage baseplate assembly protein W
MTTAGAAFPFAIDGSGRVGRASADAQVAQMIEQILFTRPGERPMRPDFGCGIAELLFEPNDELLAGATALRIRAALQRWLADLVDVRRVDVRADDAQLAVAVEWTRLLDGADGATEFVVSNEGGGR